MHKKNYVVHNRNLKYYLSEGLLLIKSTQNIRI